MLQKPKTIVELILLTLKHGEDDFIDGIEGKVYVYGESALRVESFPIINIRGV